MNGWTALKGWGTVTRAKRWPKNAEAARIDSLANAMQIGSTGKEAKQAIREGKRELAMVLVSDIQLLAKDIELKLRLIKS